LVEVTDSSDSLLSEMESNARVISEVWEVCTDRRTLWRLFGLSGSEALRLALMKIKTLLDMWPCRIINSCQDFGRYSCFHLQGGPKNYSKFIVATPSEMSVAIYQCTPIYIPEYLAFRL